MGVAKAIMVVGMRTVMATPRVGGSTLFVALFRVTLNSV